MKRIDTQNNQAFLRPKIHFPNHYFWSKFSGCVYIWFLTWCWKWFEKNIAKSYRYPFFSITFLRRETVLGADGCSGLKNSLLNQWLTFKLLGYIVPSLPNTLWGSVFGPTFTPPEVRPLGGPNTDPHKVWLGDFGRLGSWYRKYLKFINSYFMIPNGWDSAGSGDFLMLAVESQRWLEMNALQEILDPKVPSAGGNTFQKKRQEWWSSNFKYLEDHPMTWIRG